MLYKLSGVQYPRWESVADIIEEYPYLKDRMIVASEADRKSGSPRYSIEIASLDELMEFIENVGRCILHGGTKDYLPEIVVYDDWAE